MQTLPVKETLDFQVELKMGAVMRTTAERAWKLADQGNCIGYLVNFLLRIRLIQKGLLIFLLFI